MAAEMSFLDHLESLRWHLIRVLAVTFALAIMAFVYKEILFHDIILAPTRADFFTYRQLCTLGQRFGIEVFCMEELPFILQSRRMTGQFTMHIGASLVAGVVVAFPYVFWEVWRFIRPGLHVREQGVLRATTAIVSLLFFIGVLFGYFVLVPVAVQFLGGYRVDPSVLNEFDVVSYVSTVVLLVLFSGLAFELPIVMYFLARVGLVGVVTLRKWRRYAVVVILALSAMITPPDPFSQLLVSLPLFLLYECGIWVAKWVATQPRAH